MNGWKVAAIILTILGIILLLVAVFILIARRNNTTDSKWWIYLILALGIFAIIIGLVLFFVAPSPKVEVLSA